MMDIAKILFLLSSLIFKGFPTEEKMVQYFSGTSNSAFYIGGIVFPANFSGVPNSWTFKIRMKSTNERASSFFRSQTWRTDQMFPVFQIQGPRSENSPCGNTPGNKRGITLAVYEIRSDLYN